MFIEGHMQKEGNTHMSFYKLGLHVCRRLVDSPHDYFQGCSMERSPEKRLFTRCLSEAFSKWMDLFGIFSRMVFILYPIPPARPVILVMDSHASHLNP